jgi:hypothetical protein
VRQVYTKMGPPVSSSIKSQEEYSETFPGIKRCGWPEDPSASLGNRVGQHQRAFLQYRQEVLDHLLALYSQNMSANVDRGHNAILPRTDGNRNRAQAEFQLFVDKGVAVSSCLEDGIAELPLANNRFRRERSRLQILQVCLQLNIGQGGKEHSSHGCAICG